jgi:hypothetical protein
LYISFFSNPYTKKGVFMKTYLLLTMTAVALVIIFFGCSDSDPLDPNDLTLADSLAPANVTGLVATAVNESTIVLNWIPSDSSDAESLSIRVRTDGTFPVDYHDGTLLRYTSSQVTADTISGLAESTWYHIAVFVKDTSGNWSDVHDEATDSVYTESKVVIITENVNSVTTWEGDKIYIIKAWDFYVNNTLVIKPGAIIKFHPDEGPYMTLDGSGTVIAQGTVDSPIVFTSYKDDAHGGDQNGDGTFTTPAPEDWNAVNTNGCNGSVFEYCEFYYGGLSDYTLSIETGSNATVKNCTFAHNVGATNGWYGALNASSAGAATVIQNNVFYDNVWPLSISTEFSLDNSNIFHNPDSVDETNTYNGIYVDVINDITSHISWGETEVAYVIDGNDFYVTTGFTLTLGDNVVLKFRPASGINLDDGPSNLVNYDGTGVYFTSYKDDTHKGDTNADGNATSPGANDWRGIYDNTASFYMSWTNILYATN